MPSKIFDIRSRSTWSFINLDQDFELEKKMLTSWVFHSIEKIRENNSISDIASHSKNLVMYTICVLHLHIPILGMITYLAYLVIFSYDLEESYKKTLEEGNLAGAFTLIERGAEGKNSDQNGKTLLDLYLKKISKNKETEEDLAITIKLWNQGLPFDQKENDFLLFFKKAILKEGVNYCLMLNKEWKRVQNELINELSPLIAFKVQEQEFQKLLARSPTLLDRYRNELMPPLEGILDSIKKEEDLLKQSMEIYTTGTIIGKVASCEAWSPLETLSQDKKDLLATR